MNCKPGDLAVAVRANKTPEMLGRFVVVDRPFMSGEMASGFAVGDSNLRAWVIRSSVAGELLPWRGENGDLDMVKERVYADDFLRPIRPNEGEDESLSWAKPATKREGAPA